MLPNPDRRDPAYADAFKDAAVARAYRHRPPYPAGVIALLGSLIANEPKTVLDLGCGTGDIARPLAPHVERVDAVDPSAAMLAVGRALPGGDRPNIRWWCSSAEDFEYPRTYSLVVAAESLHWMAWERVFPLIRRSLSESGRFAILARNEDAPWSEELHVLFAEYSMNRDYRAFNLIDELERRGLFQAERRMTTAPLPFSQSIDDYIELQHSRSSFARARMGDERAGAFDAALRRVLSPFAKDNILTYHASVLLAWGRPPDRGGAVP